MNTADTCVKPLKTAPKDVLGNQKQVGPAPFELGREIMSKYSFKEVRNYKCPGQCVVEDAALA